jgi:hypothetical protein
MKSATRVPQDHSEPTGVGADLPRSANAAVPFSVVEALNRGPINCDARGRALQTGDEIRVTITPASAKRNVVEHARPCQGDAVELQHAIIAGDSREPLKHE